MPARPGQINYGSAGNGGISHLVPEMFKNATGLFMVHTPYRGSAPPFTDLIGGPGAVHGRVDSAGGSA